MELEAMYEGLGITPAVQKFCTEIEAQLKERFEAIDETAEYNQMKVLKAMQEARVSDIHFAVNQRAFFRFQSNIHNLLLSGFFCLPEILVR